MTLSTELQWRGFVQDMTFKDLKEVNQQTWTFYIGFDASSPSQTVGNLAAMMVALAFLRHGHRAVILAGGATSLIGDPGGKESERTLQKPEVIAQNIQNAQKQFATIFAPYKSQVTYVDNLDWFKDMKLLDFLRKIGKQFSMTPLIQRDYIASRLGKNGSGISYAEFSYTLLQGYDYLQLFDKYSCRLQIGGSDQWGNCLSGVDLIRRLRQETVQALTLPLIVNKATGKKFGKSEEGAVWLDPHYTHPSDFHQFWLNTDDADVLSYLKVFTNIQPLEMEIIEQHFAKDPSRRDAQRALAGKVTQMIHGQTAADIVGFFSHLVFGKITNPMVEADLAIAKDRWHKTLQVDDFKKTSITVKDRDKKGLLTRIIAALTENIPHLSSRTGAKRLLDSQALKVVCLDLTTGRYRKSSLQQHLAQPMPENYTAEQEVVLLVIGKNTIRPLLYV